MGVLDNIKSFFHSISTDDHYASYDSPYRNSAINSNGTAGSTSSARLSELNRLTSNNNSSQSLADNQDASGQMNSRNSSSVAVGYRPGLRSSHTTSDIQLQNFSNSGQPPLPTIDSLWDRIEAWLDEEYPELEDSLNSGVTTADLNEFENDIGAGSFPTDFRQFYKRHDGQFRGGKPTGLFMGLTLLDLESIGEEYAIWAKVSERLEKQQYLVHHKQMLSDKHDPSEESSKSNTSPNSKPSLNTFIANQKSIPKNAIQLYYAHRGWIPFAKDFCGNQLAIDLSPGPQGQWGQVIVFGRDFDIKLVISSSLQEFLFMFVSDLEAGNYQIDQSTDRERYGYLESTRYDDDFIGDEEEDEGDLSFFDKDKEFGRMFQGKGKIGYLEVLKARTLRKYRVQNIEKFNTSFVPLPEERKATESKSTTPAKMQTFKPESSVSIIKLESTSQVDLPKETLIGEPHAKNAEANDEEDTKKDATLVEAIHDKINSDEEKNTEKNASNTKEEILPAENDILTTELDEQVETASNKLNNDFNEDNSKAVAKEEDLVEEMKEVAL